ncbi:MAG: hypothetical protein KI791_10690 [Cyclobacteriaceae bacterium]|nr:hypothetical protein [Cyclobacteriaceae bacterium SS2]
MKNVTKISMTLAFTMMLAVASFGKTSTLTDEQQLLLSVNMEQSAENFEAFHSTLDVFQLAILENRELTPSQKTEALKASLTLEQKALWEANHVLERAMREDFKNSLSDEQKVDMKSTIEGSLNHEQLALIEADRILHDLMREDLQ